MNICFFLYIQISIISETDQLYVDKQMKDLKMGIHLTNDFPIPHNHHKGKHGLQRKQGKFLSEASLYVSF